MGSTFVLMLREGLEASLIVGILLAYVTSIQRRDEVSNILFGVSAAVGASVLAAGVLFFTASEFEGRAEAIFEGLAALSAVAVLTWMIFWMRRHAVDFKLSLQQKMAAALEAPGKFGLAAVAFFVVLREGIETALFFFATTRQVGAAPGLFGGALGLAAAVILGVAIYKGGVRLNFRLFFTLTGAVLLVIAAGLAAHGVHELIEASWLPAGIEQTWNMSRILPDAHGVGSFLKQLLGYNSAPTLTELLVWTAYLGVIGLAFFRPLVGRSRSQIPSTS